VLAVDRLSINSSKLVGRPDYRDALAFVCVVPSLRVTKLFARVGDYPSFLKSVTPLEKNGTCSYFASIGLFHNKVYHDLTKQIATKYAVGDYIMVRNDDTTPVTCKKLLP
jgi:hypothetical protein